MLILSLYYNVIVVIFIWICFPISFVILSLPAELWAVGLFASRNWFLLHVSSPPPEYCCIISISLSKNFYKRNKKADNFFERKEIDLAFTCFCSCALFSTIWQVIFRSDTSFSKPPCQDQLCYWYVISSRSSAQPYGWFRTTDDDNLNHPVKDQNVLLQYILVINANHLDTLELKMMMIFSKSSKWSILIH